VIIGPTLTGLPFTSGMVFQKLMSGKVPGLGKFTLPLVDVRDCAKAHFLALTSPKIQ